MNDASTMISESIIDKVDMSQFYGTVSGAVNFSCIITVDNDLHHAMKITGFRRHGEKVTFTLTCQQDAAADLISGSHIKDISILNDDIEIFTVQDHRLDAIDLDITYLQDLNCQVKLTI